MVRKIILGFLLLILGFTLGIELSNSKLGAVLSFAREGGITTEKNNIIKVVTEESQVIDVVKKSSQAVISIIASADVPKIERCYTNFDRPDPFFRDFFDFQIPSYCQRGTERQRVGAATGFIVSSDGYILTNKHVVDNEKAEYTVFLKTQDKKEEKVTARVLAKDPTNDIAILKIDRNNLPFLEFGDSDKLQVGQTAIAIGYALGEFDNTVSKGVVSGLSRSINAGGVSFGQTERLEGIIQTDAAINPGNSGGPLLDIAGKVIGMNVAMAQAQSIGFAIPANETQRVYENVKRTGKIERAYLGVRYILITDEIQKQYDLPYNHGALVVRGENFSDLAVIPGSPADRAGISENDIILEADEKKITLENSLSRTIAKKRAGEKIKLKIYHRGEEKEVEITLGERK